MSSVSPVKIPQDFCDPITLDIMINPIKTNCSHVFSKLPLTAWFREIPIPLCPLCKQRVTSYKSDQETSERIQKEFLNNKVNIQYFEEAKKALNKKYSKFIHKPLISPPPHQANQPAIQYQDMPVDDEYNDYIMRSNITVWSVLFNLCDPYTKEYFE